MRVRGVGVRESWSAGRGVEGSESVGASGSERARERERALDARSSDAQRREHGSKLANGCARRSANEAIGARRGRVEERRGSAQRGALPLKGQRVQRVHIAEVRAFHNMLQIVFIPRPAPAPCEGEHGSPAALRAALRHSQGDAAHCT